MFFKRKKKPEVKEILTELYLKKEEDYYYLFPEKSLGNYFNYYLHEFIIRDILIEFLRDRKVCIKINSGDYFGLFYVGYLETCGYDISEEVWLNNDKQTDVLLLFFDKINRAVASSLLDNFTGMWSREDLVEIFSYDKESQNSKIHLDILNNNFHNDGCTLKIMPSGDGENLKLFLNQNVMSFEYFREVLSKLLNDYCITLVLK